jgi:hypothetical protein
MGSAQPDITISLPIYIRLGKKLADRFSLNLNVYRNAHFHILSNAKLKFEKLIAFDITQLPQIAKADLSYSLFFGSKRAIDVANICCIVDKFFCDTLVNQKKLSDDNMDSISNINYRWGGVDKLNPRVEVTLSNIQTVEDLAPMQITITGQELEDMVREAVMQQITLKEDQGIAIKFQQDGAIITIQKMVSEEHAPKKMRTRRTSQAEEPTQEEPAKAQVVDRGAEMEGELARAADASALSKPIFAQPGDPATVIAKATSKIFPDVNSSAPVTEPATPPPSKSLFSNLQKPVHDTKE